MVRSIEIPEPLFEADVDARWDVVNSECAYHCKVLVAGKFVVYEKTYLVPEDDYQRGEDQVRDEFLAEFSQRFKALME